MVVDKVQISRAFLLGGEDLPIDDKLTVKHPKVGEILNLGNKVWCDIFYWNYVFTFACDPYDHMVYLDKQGINYQNITSYELFIRKYEDLTLHPDEKKDELVIMLSAIKFWLGEHIFDIADKDDGTKVLVDINDPKVYIDSSRFAAISAFIQMINCIGNRDDKINPANETARRILIEDMEAAQNRRRRSKEINDNDNLGDIISGVISGGNGGINALNFKDAPIYAITSNMTSIQKKMNYDKLLTGVYVGTIKAKELNNKQISWMK